MVELLIFMRNVSLESLKWRARSDRSFLVSCLGFDKTAVNGIIFPIKKLFLAVFSLSALLGACSVTSIGAEGRAHREEAALHKLLDGQQSYSFVVRTLTARGGYQCADQPSEFIVDKKTNKRLIPAIQGKTFTCSRSTDLNLPPISCSWMVYLNVDAIDSDVIDTMTIKSYRACM